jgi:hypothetical protein
MPEREAVSEPIEKPRTCDHPEEWLDRSRSMCHRCGRRWTKPAEPMIPKAVADELYETLRDHISDDSPVLAAYRQRTSGDGRDA